MSVTIYEKVGSRPVSLSASSRTISLEFIAMYSYDEVEVQAALISGTPLTFDGLVRQSTGSKHVGAGVWECTVEYDLSATSLDGSTNDPADPTDPADNSDPADPDNSLFSVESAFEIVPLSGHITTGYSTRYMWAGLTPSGDQGDTIASGEESTVGSDTNKAVLVGDSPTLVGDKIVFEDRPKEFTVTAVSGMTVTVDSPLGAVGRKLGSWGMFAAATGKGTAPNYEQGIGVTRDRVEGVDLPAPSPDYTYTHQVVRVTWGYYRKLESLRSKTNSATWRGWKPGEVLYLGTSGSWQTGGFWKLSHRFAMRRNRYAVRVSPSITIPFVGGWEYLWCTYRDKEISNSIFQVPSNAYVEQIFRRGTFSDIGIGV